MTIINFWYFLSRVSDSGALRTKIGNVHEATARANQAVRFSSTGSRALRDKNGEARPTDRASAPSVYYQRRQQASGPQIQWGQ
jgi:hypothetical protein